MDIWSRKEEEKASTEVGIMQLSNLFIYIGCFGLILGK
jgi:hypothetical protein